VALVATLFWALVVTFTANFRYGGDVRALLCVGEETHHPAAFGTVPTAGPWGYDGQQYAALATDPFLRDLATSESLDAPSYRATRIMVPLLAWLLALGNSGAAIVAYQLLCWGFGLAAIFLVARWLAAEDFSPWWALLLVTSAGLAAAMIRSTPDTAALFFMLAALWLYARRRYPVAVVLASAAVLARETSYLVVLAIALDALRRRRFASAAAFASVPLIMVVAWQLYLRSVLGAAFETGTDNFSLPFIWLPEKLPTVFVGGHIWWMEFLGLCAVAATVLAMVVVATKPSSWAAPWLRRHGPLPLVHRLLRDLGLRAGARRAALSSGAHRWTAECSVSQVGPPLCADPLPALRRGDDTRGGARRARGPHGAGGAAG